MGERFSTNFRLNNGIYSLFNRDRPGEIEDGQPPGKNTYSSWPVYLQRENSKLYHISYLRNQNAKDFVIVDKYGSELGEKQIQYRIIGGIIDFRYFLDIQGQPETVIKNFHKYMGGYLIPPFWSLGYHQSRWGYKNIYHLQKVIQSHKEHNLPLDGIWSDIDYMVDFENFIVNIQEFPLDKLREITDEYHYIPIVDAGIKIKSLYKNLNEFQLKQYKKQMKKQDKKLNQQIKQMSLSQLKEHLIQKSPFEKLLKYGAYIKKKEDGLPLTGKVWPGHVIYPDFFHPNATTYWIEQLQSLYDQVQFSGIWLDMNEVSCFCDGQCPNSSFVPKENEIAEDYSNSNYLPYQPTGESLEKMTISLNSTHYGGLKEFDVHNYYGVLQGQATAEFFREKLDKQPFIISRCIGPGSSQNTFHWTGDSISDFNWMQISIISIFMTNMLGMPMNGADICGFDNNTNYKICARWLQLSTFYPFMRNHNSHDKKSQEIYSLGDNVLQSGKQALNFRYQFLKQYYTLFIENKGVGTIYKPLFFKFYKDEILIENDYYMNTQIMIGDIFMQTPMLEQGLAHRRIYFPQDTLWFCFNQAFESNENRRFIYDYKGGKNKVLNNQRHHLTPIFILAGKSVFMNDFSNLLKPVLKSSELNNQFQVYCALNKIDKNLSLAEQNIKNYTPIQYFSNFDEDYLMQNYSFMSQGSILSFDIDDYNDDSLDNYNTLIKKCLKGQCMYYFTIFMDEDENIEIYINYKGENIKHYGKIQINRINIIVKNGKTYLLIINKQIIINSPETIIKIQNHEHVYTDL